MIIKHPEMAQIEGLTALWVEAFEEPKEAAQCFFDTAFDAQRSLVCLEGDAVAAGLYWFDCLWKGRKVAYIYAVGTRIAHRGKGLCHALMEKTHEVLKSRGYHGAILVPAEESLFGFYGKMGYVACCPGGIPGEKLTAQMATQMRSAVRHNIRDAECIFRRSSTLPTQGHPHRRVWGRVCYDRPSVVYGGDACQGQSSRA